MSVKQIHSEYATTGQGYKLQYIEQLDTDYLTRTLLRHTVALDTSYPSQSHVYVEVLRPDRGWVRLADLYPPSFTDAPSPYAKVDGVQLAFCKTLVVRLRKIAEAML